MKNIFVILLSIFGFLNSFGQGNLLPQGESGEKADALGNKILEAIHYKAWKNTPFVQWTFVGKRHFVWDKFDQRVSVKWENYHVVFSTKNETGKAYLDGKVAPDNEQEKLIRKAIDAFNNDSFWLNAPAKIFDVGTTRQLIDKDGKQQLLITYSSGGTTPGDSYLWTLDENGLPTQWEMWVSIIPQGGVPTTWAGWITTETGAIIATEHKMGENSVPISNVKTGHTLESIGVDKAIFEL